MATASYLNSINSAGTSPGNNSATSTTALGSERGERQTDTFSSSSNNNNHDTIPTHPLPGKPPRREHAWVANANEAHAGNANANGRTSANANVHPISSVPSPAPPAAALVSAALITPTSYPFLGPGPSHRFGGIEELAGSAASARRGAAATQRGAGGENGSENAGVNASGVGHLPRVEVREMAEPEALVNY